MSPEEIVALENSAIESNPELVHRDISASDIVLVEISPEIDEDG
jgi:hypothetical protein